MSSFNIRNIREISNDPLTKFTNQLAKKLSKFLNDQQLDKLENKEDIYSDGQDIDSILRFNNFLSTNYFNGDTQYLAPLEPDLDKLRLWIRGVNLGNTMRDYSEYDRTINLIGDPLLIDGTPFDSGLHTGDTKSIALKFNRNSTATDYIRVPNNTLIRASEGLATGISFFIRFRVSSLAQQGGANITLFEKTDNNPITDAIKVELDTAGRIKFMIENSNVQYTQETASGTVVVNTVYDVWFTYTISGNVQHIYVNNVDKTLSGTSALALHSDLDDFDYYIFRRGGGNSTGYVYGDLYDFRIYREKIVSAAEVGYMYTNKWTIVNIPFGAVMIANYFATSSTSGSGYTTTGFTTIGYDT